MYVHVHRSVVYLLQLTHWGQHRGKIQYIPIETVKQFGVNINEMFMTLLKKRIEIFLNLQRALTKSECVASLKDNNLILRGGGGWHFLEINILTLKMLNINNLSLFWKENKQSDLNFTRIGEKVSVFPNVFGTLRSQKLHSQIIFWNNGILLSYFEYLNI